MTDTNVKVQDEEKKDVAATPTTPAENTSNGETKAQGETPTEAKVEETKAE